MGGYSKPLTPAQRLLAHSEISDVTKEKLTAKIKTLNPFDIQKQIQRKLKAMRLSFPY